MSSIFPENWRAFEANSYLDVGGDAEFKNESCLLRIDALTGKVKQWDFINYESVSSDWKSLVDKVVPLIIEASDFKPYRVFA